MNRIALWGGAALLLVLCGSAGFIVQSLKPRGAVLARAGFDVAHVAPSPEPEAAPLAAAVAPRPLEQPVKASPQLLKKPEAPRANVSQDPRFQSLLAGPARFFAKKTLLGGAADLREFLSDPKRVGDYLSHPVIRGALSSPAAVRVLLKPVVIEAFLSSPAMKDAKAVRALARSSLVSEIAKAPGVQQALQDPAFIQQMLLNPQTMSWLATNPDAGDALMQFGPAFAAAAMPRPGQRRRR